MENIKFERLEKIENMDIDMTECKINDLEKFIEDKNNYAFIGIKDNKAIAFLYGYGMLRPDGKRMFYIHCVHLFLISALFYKPPEKPEQVLKHLKKNAMPEM